MSSPDPVARHLPLKPLVAAILTELAGEPRHGYAIMGRLEDLRGGRGVGPATLYRTLDQLAGAGLIEETRPKEPSGRRGASYGLTAFGRRVLAAEVRRLEALAARARGALGTDG